MTIHLSIILFLPLACAIVVALLPPRLGRSAVLAGPLLVLAYVVAMLIDFDPGGGLQYVTNDEWIPELGIHYSLGVDGLNLFMIALTAIALGVLATPDGGTISFSLADLRAHPVALGSQEWIVLPIMPGGAEHWQELFIILAVFSILYGSVLAFSQDNIRLVIAYSSIAQLGFIVLGIFAFADNGAQGLSLIHI